MLRWLAKLFGYEIMYEAWGKHWKYRYDTADHMAGRPIHEDMSVAPPSAKMVFIKIQGQ